MPSTASSTTPIVVLHFIETSIVLLHPFISAKERSPRRRSPSPRRHSRSRSRSGSPFRRSRSPFDDRS
ncbi:hypothetical protein CHS0354_040688 [Potamilus streckersoni]|uniref:Uncharacterized protein n=1 Tax=Potamilus streckersoni TaxID=2493646 RepID=A0AAE0VXT2_9BIVA|nr:hypothetical protein CHS0354_040688 [Potamilus streckersoni]